MNKRKLSYVVIGIVFLLFLGFMIYYIPTINLNTIKIESKNLLEGYKDEQINIIDEYNDSFLPATSNFSIELLKNNMSETDNILISPTSIYYALALTANGAANRTLEDFEIMLGNDLKISDLNKNYKKLKNDLLNIDRDTKMTIANSIWVANDLEVKDSFLQNDKNYYDVEVYSADFTSEQTKKDANNWISNKTNKLIKTIMEEVPTNTRMLLLNALYFNAKWEYEFDRNLNDTDKFFVSDDTTVDTEFMHIQESFKYSKNETTETIMLPYNDSKNSLLVIIPNNMNQYINELNTEELNSTIENMEYKTVNLSLPKFKVEDKLILNDTLKNMGISTAFNNADFSNMSNEDLYIDKVVHKTYIQVDELGTEAGAVTAVVMLESAAEIEEVQNMDINRPFIYAIINDQTNLPIFIGLMNNPTN